MSREIKFRAWDEKRKEWYGSSNEYSLTFNGFALFGECMAMCFPNLNDLIDIEVMQYTGLKDKNGVEIYEGDILTLHFPSSRGMKLEVKFDNKDARFSTFDIETGVQRFFNHGGMDYEIIGNIYKNPELLKESNE